MSLSGLSVREAEASVQKYGLNERTYEISFAEYFIRGITSLSCKLFVIAAMVKIIALLLGLLEVTAPVFDVTSIFVLVGLALLSALLEATVRYTSDKKTSEICICAKQSVYTVLRGGKPERIEEKMLAVGDVVYLSAGDVVPADGIVADGQFIVDQSSYGMLEKSEKTTPPSSFHGSRAMGLKSSYSLYKGSFITVGSGAMKITATGDNTFGAGKINSETRIHDSNFSSLIRAGGIVGTVSAVAVLVFCTVYGGISSGQLVKGLLEGVTASAVVLAVICLCGKNLLVEAAAANVMKKLDRQGVKVSKPDVLNDMNNVGVVFVDKTGSYTDGDYIVNGFIDGTGNQVEKLEDVNEKVVSLIKTAAVNTSTAYIDNDNTVYGGTAADRAILSFVKKASGKAKVKRQASVRKDGVSGVTVNLDSKLVTFFSGSAELVLNRCTDSFSADGKKRKITNKDALVKLAATISLTGNDVIALAVCDRVIKDEKLPTGGTLIGMIVLHDKVYENIADDLDSLEKSGIKTILMTAASRETVIYTLKKSGKRSKGVILSSEQLAKMNDKELAKRFFDIRAVVNIDYADKVRVIRAAAEHQKKTCVIGADSTNIHVLDETDTAIASSVCPSAIRSISDASSEVSGLTAAALLHRGASGFAKLCRAFISARIVCAVLAALMTVISIIGG